jgi:hypothetical protein
MLKSSLAGTCGLAMDAIPELDASAQERASERDVACLIHKQTYADGRAYRYLISDGDRQLLYVAKRTGLLLPGQTRLTEFFDIQENPVGRLQPPEVAPWLRAKDYDVYIGEEADEPFAVIHERWRLVDILLLRMPRYEVHIGEHHYIAEGNRYDTEHFYGIFVLEEEEPPVEEVEAAPDFASEAEGTEEKATEPEVEPGVEAEEFEGIEAKEILEELEDDTEEETEPEREQVGLIECPAAGPSYIVETEAEPLRQSPLVLAALVALIDMERHS